MSSALASSTSTCRFVGSAPPASSRDWRKMIDIFLAPDIEVSHQHLAVDRGQKSSATSFIRCSGTLMSKAQPRCSASNSSIQEKET